MTIFGKNYSKFYDYFYKDKDYKKECAFLETIFSELPFSVEWILDLGCGSGHHSKILSESGYNVVGVDRSENMIKIAKNKTKERNLSVRFIKEDINDIDLGRKFDVVISMFTVIGYQTTNKEIERFFKIVVKHLNNSGALLFDCWYGPAVLSQKPTYCIKEVNINNREKIVRFTEPILNILDHTIENRFKILKLNNGKIVNEFKETHLVRFFFPKEIKYFLEVAGFKKIKFLPFLELRKQLTDKDWNMFVIAIK